MTDITEQLRDAARIHVELAGQSALAATINAGADEIDRLRARVAKLESARGEPVAWMNPYGGTLQVRITGLEYEKYTIPLYTAPPAQAVDVDAISDEAIEQGCEAMWAHSYRIADPGSMRAALRAIFNKGE